MADGRGGWPALLALVPAALGVYSAHAGLWVAIVANTVLLFAWGTILRHRAAGTPAQPVAGLTTARTGLVLVLLKALLH